MRWLILSTLVSFLWVGSEGSLGPQSQSAPATSKKGARNAIPVDGQADKTAQDGLAAVRALITEKNFKDFGLDSLEDVPRLELGSPVPVYYVRADELKDYQPGTDAGRLMVNSNRRLYPVLLGDSGKLIITVEKTLTGWRIVSFGQGDIAPALTKIRREKVARTSSGPGSAGANYFVVQIPSMHLNFLAYAAQPGPGGNTDAKRSVVLTPLVPTDQLEKSGGFKNSTYLALNPSFNSEKQGGRSANEVFKALAPNAEAATKSSAPQ